MLISLVMRVSLMAPELITSLRGEGSLVYERATEKAYTAGDWVRFRVRAPRPHVLSIVVGTRTRAPEETRTRASPRFMNGCQVLNLPAWSNFGQ